jgi:hypothetical protein
MEMTRRVMTNVATSVVAGSAKIDKSGGPLVGSLVGEYDSYNANIVNLNLIYRF